MAANDDDVDILVGVILLHVIYTQYFVCRYDYPNKLIPTAVYCSNVEQTGACRTVKGNRIGLPEGFSKIKLKEKVEKRTFSLGDKMQAVHIFDRKPVNLMSTVYSGEDVTIGRKHWQT